MSCNNIQLHNNPQSLCASCTTVEVEGLVTRKIQHYIHSIAMLQSAPDECRGIFAGKKIVKIIDEMPETLRSGLYEMVWTLHGRPEGDDDYGRSELFQNPLLISHIRNRDGTPFLNQYIARLQASLEKTIFIDTLQRCKRSIEDGKGFPFSQIPNKLQELLRYVVWESERKMAGEENNPNFGGTHFGERKLLDDPHVLIRPSLLYDGKAGILDHLINQKENELHNEPWELMEIIRSQERFDTKVLRIASATQAVSFLSILRVAMELRGYTAEGGLAESLEGSTRGLMQDGHKVTILLPLYQYEDKHLPESVQRAIDLKEIESHEEYTIVKAKIGAIDCCFIKPLENAFFIPKGQNIYGRDDDVKTKERFATFSLYAADYCCTLYNEKKVDVIQIHDSQAVLAAKLMKTRCDTPPPIVFSVHNNGFSAQVYYFGDQAKALPLAGLAAKNTISLVEGITYCDALITVSHTFGKEAQDSGDMGKGVGAVFRKANAEGKFFTIVNGITTDNWDPGINPTLKKLNLDYTSTTDPLEIHRKKTSCKANLKNILEQNNLGTIDINKPLLFYVGRFDPSQKGIDKIPAIIEATKRAGGQFICIGLGHDSCPDEMQQIENICHSYQKSGAILIKDFKNENNKLHYQQALGIGPILRSAADIGVFPSIFEPCGLVQGETFVTGARVLATDCGGFSDTVEVKGEDKNGWLFKKEQDWSSDRQTENIQESVRIAVEETLATLYSQDTNKIIAYHRQTQKIMERGRTMNWNHPHKDVANLSPAKQLAMVYRFAISQAQKQKQTANPNLLSLTDPSDRGYVNAV